MQKGKVLVYISYLMRCWQRRIHGDIHYKALFWNWFFPMPVKMPTGFLKHNLYYFFATFLNKNSCAWIWWKPSVKKKNQVLQALVKDKVEEWSERKKGAACFVVFCFFLKVFWLRTTTESWSLPGQRCWASPTSGTSPASRNSLCLGALAVMEFFPWEGDA